MYDDGPADPISQDEGRFIPSAELISWHNSMKARMPDFYPADDKLFGDQTSQHIQDTKLMTFFDEDPNKPMRCTVRGSQWVKDCGENEPYYVVRFKNSTELSRIALTSAHEEGGWRIGWDNEAAVMDETAAASIEQAVLSVLDDAPTSPSTTPSTATATAPPFQLDPSKLQLANALIEAQGPRPTYASFAVMPDKGSPF